MVFEYCETCQKITFGGYLSSATDAVKIFLCKNCFAITYIDIQGEEINDEAWGNDYKLRNESIKLQRIIFNELVRLRN